MAASARRALTLTRCLAAPAPVAAGARTPAVARLGPRYLWPATTKVGLGSSFAASARTFCAGAAPDAMEKRVIAAVKRYAEVRKGELQNEGEAADKEKILALLDGEVTPATKWDDLGFDDLDKVSSRARLPRAAARPPRCLAAPAAAAATTALRCPDAMQAPRLPIAARGCDAGLLQADPSAAGVRGLSTPSRSRRAGPQSSPAASSPTPTQALLCADASGGASYREQLRASGKQALLQVREGARSAPKRAEPSPVALADQIAAPPFGAAHAAPAGARTPLTTRGFAAPLGGSPFATAADQQAPLVFVHPATGAAYAGPQAAPSPFALADVLALTPGSAGAPGVVSFHCPGGYQGCAVGPPAAVQHGGRGVPAEAQGFMVIAMATAPAVGSGMSQGLSGEELAAHLRAAAPDMYED